MRLQVVWFHETVTGNLLRRSAWRCHRFRLGVGDPCDVMAAWMFLAETRDGLAQRSRMTRPGRGVVAGHCPSG